LEQWRRQGKLKNSKFAIIFLNVPFQSIKNNPAIIESVNTVLLVKEDLRHNSYLSLDRSAHNKSAATMGQCLSAVNQIAEQVEEAQAQQQAASAHPTDGALSPVYPALPQGAEKVTVRNVYDGDTLTLRDERRVRFLGIDTPELKEKQPFAAEAKAYTKAHCVDNSATIWISFDGDRQDHYGRLLAFVWVAVDGGYLCVNEGIVAAGLASVYTPNTKTRLHNWSKLVALQTQAREQKLGLWRTFVDTTVYKTANGAAYHKRSCEHLSAVRHLTEMPASEAAAQGLHPCRTCLS
jgi:micrococcal nuclease